MSLPPSRTEPPPTATEAMAGECPRCGRPYAADQEYCLECGLRLPAAGLVQGLSGGWRRRMPWYPGDWVWPALLALLIAVLGATVAILATRDKDRQVLRATSPPGQVTTAPTTVPTAPTSAATQGTTPTTPTTATPTDTSTTATAAPPPSTQTAPIEWPTGASGYTVILASVPATSGRAVAVAQARKAIADGVPTVGVLDSSQYSTLHPGYFVVFSGVADSYSAAQDALEAAKESGYGGAYVRQITS